MLRCLLWDFTGRRSLPEVVVCPVESFSTHTFFFRLANNPPVILKVSLPNYSTADPSIVLLFFNPICATGGCEFGVFLTVNKGIFHGNILTVIIFFMLTDTFCNFVWGFYSIKYSMDLH